MATQRYSVTPHPIETLLTWVKSGEIAIPEIQRPFVWDGAKVRNLLDSLYRGYPIGYLISWRNPTVKLKDGTSSAGKRVLIDGQQRVTALMAALLGREVLTQEYETVRIRIAFHPVEEKFEVTNPAIGKDVAWIPDVAELFSPSAKLLQITKAYAKSNSGIEENELFSTLERLRKIINNHVGVIELAEDLDIETVTEIFIRVNSAGASLSQADFAMKKGDPAFAKSEFYPKMTWLKDVSDDIYGPSYTDMLRVAFTSEFGRGKLQDLVALLSGRNFDTKKYEEVIAEKSFGQLKEGILRFINKTHFDRIAMILRSGGFVSRDLFSSQNALNFAYILYLRGRAEGMPAADLERVVRRWYAMSVLLGRYAGSPETAFDFDIRQVEARGLAAYAKAVIQTELPDSFWSTLLPQNMDTSSASSPMFLAYQAAQVKLGDRGFLSHNITVRDLLLNRSDLHHVFPRNHLKKKGLQRGRYNQIANFVLAQSEINIAIGDTAPEVYFEELAEQCSGGKKKYGGITDIKEMRANLRMNCLPEPLLKGKVPSYDEFLQQRRTLMAQKIKTWFDGL